MAKLKNVTTTVDSSIIVNHIFQKENQAGGTTVTISRTDPTDRKRANCGKRVVMLKQ